MDNLEQKLIAWFSEAHTLMETYTKFERESGHDIVHIVMGMHQRGVIISYPSNEGEMYICSVRVEPDMDIGV